MGAGAGAVCQHQHGARIDAFRAGRYAGAAAVALPGPGRRLAHQGAAMRQDIQNAADHGCRFGIGQASVRRDRADFDSGTATGAGIDNAVGGIGHEVLQTGHAHLPSQTGQAGSRTWAGHGMRATASISSIMSGWARALTSTRVLAGRAPKCFRHASGN